MTLYAKRHNQTINDPLLSLQEMVSQVKKKRHLIRLELEELSSGEMKMKMECDMVRERVNQTRTLMHELELELEKIGDANEMERTKPHLDLVLMKNASMETMAKHLEERLKNIQEQLLALQQELEK